MLRQIFTLLVVMSLGAAICFAQWTQPVPMTPQLGTAVWGPWISNDGLRLYASGGGYIQVIERDSISGPWHQWHSVSANINSGIRQESPCESPSGDTLYFMSYERPEGCYGGYDIYYSVRTDTGWGPVVNCGPNINSSDTEWSVGITRDGSSLLISAHRPNMTSGRDLFYSSKQADGTWGPLVHLGAPVSTADDDEHPSMSPDNNTIYFCGPGYHMGDIWYSRRVNGEWQASDSVHGPINTLMQSEWDPCVSADGRTLWFIRQDSNHDNTLLFAIDTTVTAAARQRTSYRPTSAQLTVQTDTAGHLQIFVAGYIRPGECEAVIFDVLGREVARSRLLFRSEQQGIRSSLNINAIANGTYFMTLQIPGHSLHTKFVWSK